MADNPPTLWAGVPTGIDASGRIELLPGSFVTTSGLTTTLGGYVSTAALATALGDYLPLTGGVLSGPGTLTVGGGAAPVAPASLAVTGSVSVAGATVTVQAPAASDAYFTATSNVGRVAGLQINTPTPATRWVVGKDATNETGGNSGSNFIIARYPDTGATAIGNPLTINRASGLATFSNGVTVTPINVGANGFQLLGTAGAPNITWSATWTNTWNSGTGNVDWNTPWVSTNPAMRITGMGVLWAWDFQVFSDEGDKHDITDAGDVGLETIDRLRPKRFRRIIRRPPRDEAAASDQPSWPTESRKQLGFIAQDVQAAFPDAAVEQDGKLSVSMVSMIAALVNSVRQLSARVQELEART